MSEIYEALKYLFSADPGCQIWVGAFAPGTRGERFTDLQKAAEYAERLDPEVQGVYVRHTGLALDWQPKERGGRGTSEESSMLFFLSADVDIRGPGHVSEKYAPDEQVAREMIAAAGLPPTSAYIRSGGGIYPVWKLTKPHALSTPEEQKRAARLERGWYKHLNSVSQYKIDNTSDQSRVYRLPGTRNRKPAWGESPPLARIIECDGPTYTLEELEEGLTRAAGTEELAEESSPSIFAVPSEIAAASRRGEGREGDRPYTLAEAQAFVVPALERLEAAGDGDIRNALLGAGMALAHFDTGRFWTREAMEAMLHESLSKTLYDGATWQADVAINNCFSDTAKGNAAGNLEKFWYARFVLDASPDVTESTASSWEPVDLTAVLNGEFTRPEPTLGMRADGQYMLYPGKEHAIASEPECGKTWWVLLQMKAVLANGGRVVYLDFEDDEGTIIPRALDIGIPKEELNGSTFRYIRPDEQPQVGIVTKLCTFPDGPADLVILDGMTEGLGLLGLSALDQEAIVQWRRVFVKPAMRLGSATLTTDHVVKDASARGRYAIGAQHKLAGLNGVMFIMTSVTPFGKGFAGSSKVIITKDRNGSLRQHGLAEDSPGQTHIGTLKLSPGSGQKDTNKQQWTFTVPERERSTERTTVTQTPGLPEKDHKYLESILGYVAGNPWGNKTAIVKHAGGNAVELGRVFEWMRSQPGILQSRPHNRTTVWYLDPYVAAADPAGRLQAVLQGNKEARELMESDPFS